MKTIICNDLDSNSTQKIEFAYGYYLDDALILPKTQELQEIITGFKIHMISGRSIQYK
jgi:hypothetical protein